MRNWVDIFGQMFRTLWAHKLRSFLTMFGIAWGVGSLLLLVGLGEGFRTGQRRQLADLGQNVMFLFPGRTPAIEGSLRSMRPYRLGYGDYEAVRAQAHFAGAVAGVIERGDVRAVTPANSTASGITGVSPAYNQILNVPLRAGRWFSDGDDDERRHVAILGSETARLLFPGQPAVGNRVLLNGSSFEVIGVIRKIGKDQNGGRNSRCLIPLQTMMAMFALSGEEEKRAVSYINYRPRTRGEHEITRDEVHRIIAARHNFDPHSTDAFEDNDTVQEEETLERVFDAMDWFLGAVGLVTLGLGALGITNIMLVSVAERTHEIGLRKALGATRRSILTQFFLEGAFLTLSSGLIGVACTMALMAALKSAPMPAGFDPPHIVPLSAAVAIAALSLAGTAAGLYPARRAAMLAPVDALRFEL